MKQFIAFVRKEFHHIFRDRRTMMILLAMPIVLIVLFGFAITTEVNHVRIAVYAPSNDNLTRQITERFGANPYFEIVAASTGPNDTDRLFRESRADAAIVFSDNFENNLMHTGRASVQLIIDGSEPNTASMINSYMISTMARLRSEMGDVHPSAGAAAGGYMIDTSVKLLWNPQMKSSYNFVPGTMGLILMLICAMMTSISIVREKERGTMEVLLASPMRPIAIIIAKVVPYLCISAINVISIVLLAVFALGVPMTGSVFWIGVLSLIYIFVSLSLGVLISSMAATQVTAMLASGMLLMMPTMILSGMIFPIENMPAVLQWLSNVIPARWYISGIKKLMIQGLGPNYVVREFAVLAGMGVFLITVSLKLFKHRLE